MEFSETIDFREEKKKNIPQFSPRLQDKIMSELRVDQTIYGKMYRYIQAQMITKTNWAWSRLETLEECEDKAWLDRYYCLMMSFFDMYAKHRSVNHLQKTIKYWYDKGDDDQKCREIKNDLYLNFEFIRKGLKEHLYTEEMDKWIYPKEEK